MIPEVLCDYCKKPAKLISGREAYPQRPDLYSLKIWECKPCRASVGTHKNSEAVPLGRLANKELKNAKMRAHAAFDPIWKTGKMRRGDAYKWLAKEMKIPFEYCHIGMFNESDCQQVVEICTTSRDP